MPARKYPLGALAQVREAKVDAAAQALAGAVRAREDAGAKRRGAEARKGQHAQAVRAIEVSERTELDAGALSAADLARGDAWGLRSSLEAQALATTVEQTRSAEARALDAQAKAQREAADRKADARVVEKHREAWDAARRAAVDAADEEASAEAWRRPG